MILAVIAVAASKGNSREDIAGKGLQNVARGGASGAIFTNAAKQSMSAPSGISLAGAATNGVGKGTSHSSGLAFNGAILGLYLTKDLYYYNQGSTSGTQVVKNTFKHAGSMVGAGIGQFIIPIPYVGGLIGGAIGYMVTSILIQ